MEHLQCGRQWSRMVSSLVDTANSLLYQCFLLDLAFSVGSCLWWLRIDLFSPNSTISSSFNVWDQVFSFILSMDLSVSIFSVIYNQSLLSHYFFATLSQSLPVGLLLSCCASIFFLFLIWWGVIPYFLTKLSLCFCSSLGISLLP